MLAGFNEALYVLTTVVLGLIGCLLVLVLSALLPSLPKTRKLANVYNNKRGEYITIPLWRPFLGTLSYLQKVVPAVSESDCLSMP